MKLRQVIDHRRARPSSDGDGVQLLRVFGGSHNERFDPFLLMDEFGSDSADDYIGGFPAHPHRGFQTMTYMLQGKMEHRDHLGNVGLISDGDVQWMNAGKGVIHSEMPQQSAGKMRGFQIWLNLPAAHKFSPAQYRDVAANDIPKYSLNGNDILAIAGRTRADGTPIEGHFQLEHTQALFLDIHLQAGGELSLAMDHRQNALVYTYEGESTIGGSTANSGTLSCLEDDGHLHLHNRQAQQARVIVLAGTPLNEPVVQHGPFVMNTHEQIHQAIRDYQQGTLTA